MPNKRQKVSQDSSSSESEEEKKEPPKVSYISQTLSGRNPKPPERYQVRLPKQNLVHLLHFESLFQEKEKKKSKHKRHKGSPTTLVSNNNKSPPKTQEQSKNNNLSSDKDYFEDSSDDEIAFRRVPKVSFDSLLNSPTSSTTSSSGKSSLSPTEKARKVGITIKKSPNSSRTFETSLLGEDSDDESMSEIDDDEDEYENFKSSLLDHALTRESVQAHKNSTKDLKRKKHGRETKLTDEAIVSLGEAPLSDMFLNPDSDSEYEFEEIVELCEWYPPDFWRSNTKGEDKIRLTDVTVNDLTVTMRESKSDRGFFAAS